MNLRRLALLLAATLATSLAVPGVGADRTAEGAAVAKKAPPCKAGTNRKKCRCPKGSSLKKRGKGYRCAKQKKAPATQPAAGDDQQTPTAGPGAEPVPPAAPVEDRVRNDQALIDALKGAAFYKTYSGGGFGSYAYNFLPESLGEVEGRTMFRLRYCTYYYAVGFTSDRSNHNGVWLVKEGYTSTADPTLITGVLQLFRQDMPQDQVVEAPVAVQGGSAAIKTGDGSKYFEPGDYEFKAGQATTDCETWVPA